MPRYNLIEYSASYSKISGGLWKYCKVIPAVDNNGAIVDSTENNLNDSFHLKVKITGQTGDNGTNRTIKIFEQVLENS